VEKVGITLGVFFDLDANASFFRSDLVASAFSGITAMAGETQLFDTDTLSEANTLASFTWLEALTLTLFTVIYFSVLSLYALTHGPLPNATPPCRPSLTALVVEEVVFDIALVSAASSKAIPLASCEHRGWTMSDPVRLSTEYFSVSITGEIVGGVERDHALEALDLSA
jgi:hypothetical protein